MSHRLEDAHDRAAAALLRAGDAAAALGELDAAGHLHIVEDEYAAYAGVLGHWWDSCRAGEHHPMVSRRNDVRRTLNRLAHQLRRAAGEIGDEEMAATGGRRYSIGDRVIARLPHRRLQPTGEPGAYMRNGALGTVTGLRHGARPHEDELVVDFDGLGTVTVTRSFFDEHAIDRNEQREAGIDHAYAVTSYAVTGATHPVSTSRIDESSSRAEAYVDITRGRRANHLFLTRASDDLDGEHLPRVPPDPLDDAVAVRLATSNGERTAWEVRQDAREAAARPGGQAIAL